MKITLDFLSQIITDFSNAVVKMHNVLRGLTDVKSNGRV